MEKEYVEKSSIGHCLLQKEDIIALTNKARDEFPNNHGFEIQAAFGNVQGYWNDIFEFLKLKGLPNTPQELIFNVWYPMSPEIERSVQDVTEIKKSVRISFGPLGSYIIVSSINELWVMGKHEQITRFFEEKYSRINFLKERSEKILKSDLFASMIVSLWVIGISKLDSAVLSYAILFSISSTYITLKYLNWARKKIKIVNINLKPRTRFVLLGMEANDVIPIIISILVLIVLVIKLFI